MSDMCLKVQPHDKGLQAAVSSALVNYALEQLHKTLTELNHRHHV